MKKPLFSLAFLLSILVVSYGELKAQSISSFFNIKFSEESIEDEQQEKLSIGLLEENNKKDVVGKLDEIEVRKIDKPNLQPSSSRISIGLGKSLFEKYIK